MKQKVSFFKKAVIKSDFKRFWWIGALEGLIILFAVLATISEADGYVSFYDMSNPNKTWLFSPFYNSMSPAFVLALTFPVAAAVLIFSYLHKGSSVSSLHGIPVTRGELFASHMFSGFMLTLAPVVLNVLILLAALGSHQFVGVWFILKHAAVMLLYTVIAFSFAALVSMLAGNAIAAAVLTYIFALVPLFLEMVAVEILQEFVFGFTMPPEGMFTSRYLYLGPGNGLIGARGIATFVILSAMFIAAAYLLYRKRSLENHGEVIAFKRFRPVFIYGAAVCLGLCGYLYIRYYQTGERFSIAGMLLFGILGLAAAQMIVRKSFNIRGIWKHILIYSAAVLVFAGAIKIDVTGYERRVPDVEDVEAAYALYTPDKSLEDTPETYAFTEKADIELVTNMHRYFVEHRYGINEPGVINLPVYYKLKNGSVIRRMYYMDYKRDTEVLKPLYESEQIKKGEFPILNNAEKTVTAVDVYDKRCRSEKIVILGQDFEKLLNALKKDLSQVKYEVFKQDNGDMDGGGTGSMLQVSVREEYALGYSDNSCYYVFPGYDNTLSVLSELGVFSDYYASEEIQKAVISFGSPYHAYHEYKGVEYKQNISELPDYEEGLQSNKNYEVNDRASLEKLYNEVFMNLTAKCDVHVKGYDENGADRVYIIFKTDNPIKIIEMFITPEEFESVAGKR